MQTDILLAEKYATLLPFLGEKKWLLILAADAKAMGRGGRSKVAKLSGVSEKTLDAALKDLASTESLVSNNRSRRSGGGRKKAVDKDADLLQAIENIVSPHTTGDPVKPLQWTAKSLRTISEQAKAEGFDVSHKLIGGLLKNSGYNIQSNRKTEEGERPADRYAQFEYINETAARFLKAKDLVISVDCRKKEETENTKNAEQDWLPNKTPAEEKVYNFTDNDQGKEISYGDDQANNEGWVSAGIDHDTACFAVAMIRSWWTEMGHSFKSKKLFITADIGGSNSPGSSLWKKELQLFANESGLEITVSHYPSGTSKWNKIEQRLFSYVTVSREAKPPVNVQFIIDRIGDAATKGPAAKSKSNNNFYEKGVKILDEESAGIKITGNKFHEEWNYKINPMVV